LFEHEAIAFGIDLDRLRRGGHVRGVGGRVNACILENVKVEFLNDDHQWVVVPFEAVEILVQRKNAIRRMIAILTKFVSNMKGKSTNETHRGLPNLLGFDFLKDCRISFSETEAYLDIEVS